MDLSQWLPVVSNLGVPISLLLYYLLVERPRQVKKEEEQQRRWEDNLKSALKEQRADFEATRQGDRENSLEIAKLTSEIHAATSREITASVRDNGERIKELKNRLEAALEEFKNSR